MKIVQFKSTSTLNFIDKGRVSWQSPSNIALVKYWGKLPNQIPANPSISFTLDSCKTITTLEFQKKKDTLKFSFEVYFEGKPNQNFKPKIETFFERISSYVSFLKHYHFVIRTENTFPHSSGIASSASGMSALALCLLSMEELLLQEKYDKLYFVQKASFLARLGSGSACRSIEGPLVVWGSHKSIPNSNNEFGVQFPFSIHPVFKNYQDTILLVDKGQKEISSTLGHDLMHNHPFAKQRFRQAHNNLDILTNVLQKGNVDEFIKVTESEALTLHAMMLTSNPYFILVQPNTLEIINHIWQYRKTTNSKLCFTLDAGANVHVLYPNSEKDTVLQFIKNELVAYCENAQYICDNVGKGATQL